MFLSVALQTVLLNFGDSNRTFLGFGHTQFQRRPANHFLPGVSQERFKGFIDIGKDVLGQFRECYGIVALSNN